MFQAFQMFSLNLPALYVLLPHRLLHRIYGYVLDCLHRQHYPLAAPFHQILLQNSKSSAGLPGTV